MLTNIKSLKPIWLVIFLYLAIASHLDAQPLTVNVTNSCPTPRQGIIELVFDASILQEYPLPYTCEIENINTGYLEVVQLTTLQHLFEFLNIGNYELIIKLNEDCELYVDTAIESLGISAIYSEVINGNCCEHQIQGSLEGDDLQPYLYSLFKRTNTGFDLVESGIGQDFHFTDLCTGRYKLVGENGDCFYSKVIFVNKEIFDIELVEMKSVSDCYIENGAGYTTTQDGSLEVTVNNSSVNFTYRWKKGNIVIGQGSKIEDLEPNIYILELISLDDPSCILAQKSYEICCCGPSYDASHCIESGFNPTVNSTVTNASNLTSLDGSINLQISGLSGSTFTYSWTGPAGFTSLNKNISFLNPGLYVITISNGCSEVQKQYVVGNEDCDDEIVIEGDVTCIVDGVSSGSIVLTVSGGNPPYQYAWSDVNKQGPNITLGQNQQGVYSVIVYDANFCLGSTEFIVSQVPEIIFTVDIEDESDCPNEAMNMIATVDITQGEGPFTYQWNVEDNPGPHNESFVYIPPQNAGTYSVKVTDMCGISKSVNGSVSCRDYSCDEENNCIKIERKGKDRCSDFCDDVGMFDQNELICDRIKIECNCDDGAERVVRDYSGRWHASFIGKEIQDGKEKWPITTYDKGTFGFRVENKTTGCWKNEFITVPTNKCGLTGFVDWISTEFSGGGGNSGGGSSSPCTDSQLELDYFDGCIEIWSCPFDNSEFEVNNRVICWAHLGESAYAMVDHCDCVYNSHSTVYMDFDTTPSGEECGCDFSYLISGNLCDSDPVGLQYDESTKTVLVALRFKDSYSYKFHLLDQSLNLISVSPDLHYDAELTQFKVIDENTIVVAGHDSENSFVETISNIEGQSWKYSFGRAGSVRNIKYVLGETSLLFKSENEDWSSFSFNSLGQAILDSPILNSRNIENIVFSNETEYLSFGSRNSNMNFLSYVKNNKEIFNTTFPKNWAVKEMFMEENDEILLFANITGYQRIGDVDYNFNDRSGIVSIRYNLNGEVVSSQSLVETSDNNVLTAVERISQNLYTVIGYKTPTLITQNELINDSYFPDNSFCSFIKNINLNYGEEFEGDITYRFSEKPVRIFAIPNPFDNSFSVDISSLNTSKVELQLLDINGQILQQKNNLSSFENKRVRFDGTELTAGIYFIRVISIESSQILKIIKE